MRIQFTLLFVLLGLIFPDLVKTQSAEQLEALDLYFETSLSKWNVPGMAVAIVKDDQIIFEKGYGFRNLESGEKADENTLFAVASNTKAFTASALAKLVEEKRIAWKDKVSQYLPYFALNDEYAMKEMTIEDLLCHRSGLKTFSGDLLWYGSNKTAREVLESAQYLKPELDFRADYGYSNIMYIAAGLVIESVTDTSYKEYIQHHFLQPLQMKRSILSTSDLKYKSNVATPYYVDQDEIIALDWLNWDNVMAAGGLISSAHDMANWLMLNASKGKFYGEKFLDEESFEKLTTPHINFKVSAYTRNMQPSKHFRGYGLGWSLGDYHGRKIISHGGGYDGMISKTCIVPEEKLALVILTNSLNYLPSALIEKSLDVILSGLENGTDYSSLYLQSFERSQMKRKSDEEKIESGRGQINTNHLPLDQYSGTYKDLKYGELKVWLEGGKLHFKMDPTQIFTASLDHWNDHIFTFRFPINKSSLPMGKLWFHLDDEAKVNKLLMDVVNPDFHFQELEFTKIY